MRLDLGRALLGAGVTVLAWAGVATADGIPGRGFLPENRGYELVSGGGQDPGEAMAVHGLAADGNTVAFGSVKGTTPDANGAGTEVLSIARRSAGGWHSTDPNLPLSQHLTQNLAITFPVQFSPDFSQAIFETNEPLDPQDQDSAADDFYRLHFDTLAWDWLSHGDALPDTVYDAPLMVGASEDLSRLVYWSQAPTGRAIYIVDAQGRRLASVLPDGTPAAGGIPAALIATKYLGDLGYGSRAPHGGLHPASDDGQRVFFYDNPIPLNAPLYLYDRDHTVLVSASQRTGDVGTAGNATFVAASHDGSVSYFHSPDQLTDDAPAGGGLYRYDVDAGALTFLTPDPGEGLWSDQPGMGAIVSDDMSHIYFLSTNVLATGGQAGGSNLYVWSAADGTRYVATLPYNEGRPVRVSRDGRYVLVTSSQPLGGAPNDGHAAIYEYDAETQQLACVSCRADGSPSQGDATLNASMLEPGSFFNPSNLTDDGRVVFATSDRLVPGDVGAGADVYLYDHGTRSLISSGRSAYDSFVAGNTDDGRDVLFLTRDRLVAADPNEDGSDVYDARVDGGFPEAAGSASCEGDDCQGAGPARLALAPPGSATATADATARVRFLRLLRLSAATRARLSRTGSAALTLRVRGGGTVTVRAKGAHGRTLGSGKRAIRSKGSVRTHVTLRLTRAARRQLAHRGRLRITIEAVLRGVPGVQRTTVTLTSAHR